MTSIPNPTRYHRWLGWHAPALRRAVIVGSIGLIVALVLMWFVPWGMAVVAGWDAAALTFLVSVWSIIIRADSGHVVQLAKREDETRGSATVLLLGASAASLVGVGFALILAGRHSGPLQVLLVGVAVLTVVLSWTVVNTVYTLRYADQTAGSGDAGISFENADGSDGPTYRDFAYVAFTIGMCYQGVRYHCARSTDPAHGALPRFLVVRVRRCDRWWFGQPHRRPGSLMSRARGLARQAGSAANAAAFPAHHSPGPVEPDPLKFRAMCIRRWAS